MPDQPNRPNQPNQPKRPNQPNQPPRSNQPNPPDAQAGRPNVPGRPGGEPSGEEREQFRQPNFWYNEQDREMSFKMEDARWATSEQIKDWGKLGIMVLLTFIWCLIVYFSQPGLR